MSLMVLPLKPALRMDLAKALGDWLDNDEQQVSYKPTNPLQMILPKPDFGSAACREDLLRLASLRNCLADALLKQGSHAAALQEGALDDAHEYHAALLQFEQRGFPTLDDAHNGLKLQWKGAFGSNARQETHSHLLWDRACVTYNIVALTSYQAAQCNVNDRDSCKTGVGLCQQAASILETLRELVLSQDFATVDLSQALLSFWQAELLAQGQTYVYRMAVLGNGGNHVTLSGLSQSAFLLWNEALSAAQDARLQSEVPKPSQLWATYSKTQAMMAAAKAEYHQAALARLDHSYGVEIVRLRQSLTKLQACEQFLQTLTDDEHLNAVDYTQRELTAILPVVRDRLREIERDNAKVYNEEIPDSVPEVEPKKLIKSSLGYPTTMLSPKKQLFADL